MDWWFATMGIVFLSLVSVATRSALLSFITLMLFMPLALDTLYHEFSRFWILMALSFAVEVLALARYLMLFARREQPHGRRLDNEERAAAPSLA